MPLTEWTEPFPSGRMAASSGPVNPVADAAYRFTLLGDGGVGKTCILLTYTNGAFPGEYIPTVFDQYRTTVTADGVDYDVRLDDSSGGDDLEIVRSLQWSGSSVFILCFSCVNPNSMARLETLWLPEAQKALPGVQIVFVCTKTDLRNDAEAIRRTQDNYQRDPITTEEGRRFAKRFKVPYFEVSSLTQPTTLQTLFLEVMRMAVRKQKSSSCTLI